MTQSSHPLPGFDDLADDFYRIGCVCSPAEFHGLLCGRQACGQPVYEAQWRQDCLEFLGLGADASGPELDRVMALRERVTLSLADDSLAFDLLLPDEDYELAQRAEALGQWCEGFLSGLAMAGEDQLRWEALPEELVEGLSDLATIAQISADDEEGESNEKDLMEICEYVRMVAMNVYAELVLHHAAVTEPEEAKPVANPAQGLFSKKLH